MSISEKILLSVTGVVLVAAIALFVIHTPTKDISAGASPQGSTISTPTFKGAIANLSAPGANATSTSILNNTGNDLYITGLTVACEGVGTSFTAYTGAPLAALTVYAATTSTAAPATVSNTNKVGGGSITIATTTPQFVQASTTAENGVSSVYNIWPAASYLTFVTNATNTASCTFGATVAGS